MATVQAFLSVVAAEDLECWMWDVKNAFTEAKLTEEIFMAPPEGVPVKPGHCLRLNKSLYGLKQAARNWNTLLKAALLEMGFQQSQADHCLFVHPKGITLLVYVDDILGAAKSTELLKWFDKQLKKSFTANCLFEVKKFLGMRITRDRKNRRIYIDQESYIDKVLRKLGFPNSKSDAKPPRIPVSGYEDLRPGGILTRGLTKPNMPRLLVA